MNESRRAGKRENTRTTCRAGHPRTPENIRREPHWKCPDGLIRCVLCKRADGKRRQPAAGRRRWLRSREKILARNAVYAAVLTGRLTKTPCTCGAPKVQAHHHRGYDMAHRYDVVWLCIDCHRRAHGR